MKINEQPDQTKNIPIELPISHVIDTGIEGPELTVIGGMHGDEPSSIRLLEKLIYEQEELGLVRGVVTLVIANPTAYKHGVRAVNKNLNSMLSTQGDSSVGTPELESATFLMELLSNSDACLDLHEHKDFGMGSLAMAPVSLRPIVDSLGVDLFVHGLETVEPGATDAFMAEIGKPGICVELGYYKDDNTAKAREVLTRYLSVMGVIERSMIISQKPLVASAKDVIIRQTEHFSYATHVKSGVLLPEGVFAQDGSTEYYANGSSTGVLFPRPNNPIGSSVGILIDFEEIS